MYSRVTLGCKTNDRDSEKKTENLDHGRGNPNYPQAVLSTRIFFLSISFCLLMFFHPRGTSNCTLPTLTRVHGKSVLEFTGLVPPHDPILPENEKFRQRNETEVFYYWEEWEVLDIHKYNTTRSKTKF